jgi:hypothetical protein
MPGPFTLGGVLVASAGSVRAQTGPECPASTLTPTDAGVSSRWSAAAEALSRELLFADRPWSCAGATVALELRDRGRSAIEVTMPDGLLLRRHVDRASELLPTVEAMLTVGRAAPEAAAPVAAPAAASRPPIDDHERPPLVVMVRSRGARLAPPPRPAGRHIDAELIYRVAGPLSYSTPGVRAGAGLQLGHWGVRVGLQYEALSVGWSATPDELSVESWSVYLGVAWLTPVGRGVLGIGPTVAILSSAIAANAGAGLSDDEIAQARVGLSLRWRSRAQGVALLIGARADASVGNLFGSGRDYNPALPSPATWGVDVSAGVSFGARP